MGYRYEIHNLSDDLIVATIDSDEPLPHLEVGHELLVEIDGHEPKRGYHLEIQRIRVRLVRKHKASALRFEVLVVCEERAQTPPR